MTKKKKLINIPNEKIISNGISISSKLANIEDAKINTNLKSEPIDQKKPSICLKHLDLNFKSFYDLRSGNNLKHFDQFMKKVHRAPNWDSVFNVFRKDSTNSQKSKQKLKSLGFDHKQIELFHLRVTRRFRVHGFQIDNRFKLVWIDPDHEID